MLAQVLDAASSQIEGAIVYNYDSDIVQAVHLARIIPEGRLHAKVAPVDCRRIS
jgi:hypothetical protein